MITRLCHCRLCHKDARTDECVKYSVRHYAHFACWLDAGRGLSGLSSYQVGQFPYRLLREHGLLKEAHNAA